MDITELAPEATTSAVEMAPPVVIVNELPPIVRGFANALYAAELAGSCRSFRL
jgi:hypothetical protein